MSFVITIHSQCNGYRLIYVASESLTVGQSRQRAAY